MSVALRPRVGVSSCLLGEPVRYDGAQKGVPWIARQLGAHVTLVSICPEVGAGMSVPRPPIQIVQLPGRGLRLQLVGEGGDVSDAMDHFAERQLASLAEAPLDGYVFKARSPSCGLVDTPYFASAEQGARPLRLGPGIWAARVSQRLPSIPLVDESALQSAQGRQDFLARVLAHCRAHKSPKP